MDKTQMALKQILLNVRNGAMITPAIWAIDGIYRGTIKSFALEDIVLIKDSSMTQDDAVQVAKLLKRPVLYLNSLDDVSTIGIKKLNSIVKKAAKQKDKGQDAYTKTGKISKGTSSKRSSS